MSKKRDKINRRRQITKARKGTQRSTASKSRPSTPRENAPSSLSDLLIAVGVVVLIIGAFVALWYFTVYRPRSTGIDPTIVVQTPEPTMSNEQPTVEGESMRWSEPPAMTLDTAKDYEATIKTEKGDIRIELYDDQAPNTVNNFVFLARQGFYDGVIFHRVMSGFMAQGGDPTGTGSGGPGYSFADEFSPDLRHDSAGIVSMANAGADTNGSQFFITYAPQPHLDDKHSVFGKVVEGMDVVESLTPRDPRDANPPPGDVILTVEIVEK
jgi:peptidyl-prolyl cis-trans isomerase B (cyclophilin B)